MAAITCQQMVGDERGRNFKPCGRKIKGEHNGIPMCGIHLGAARRRSAKFAAWEAADQSAETASEQVRAELDRLGVHTELVMYAGSYVLAIRGEDWDKLAAVLRGVNR